MTTPAETARTALDRSVRLGLGSSLHLEVYAQSAHTTSIKVFGGQVESLVTAEPRGLGVRAVDGGRVGYAYTGDVTEAGIDRVLLEAAENAAAADPDAWAALPESPEEYAQVEGLWSPGVARLPVEDKARLALEAEAAALRRPEVGLVEESEYSDSDSQVAIVSSRGVAAEMEESFCLAYVMALAGHEGDRQSGLGFTMGRSPGELDPQEAGTEAAGKAAVLLGARPCATGHYSVVFTPEVGAALLAAVAGALSADAVQKGRSVFAGYLGEEVGGSLVDLWDDGLAVGGLSTAPFDGEGVPSRRTVLLSEGVLRSYLHDTYTARKEGRGTVSTGNATRSSYRSVPAVGNSNLLLRGGSGTLDDLVQRVGDGLLVENAAGIHSGVNPSTGEISLGVLGHLIEGGAVGRPVREVTIATDFLTLLHSMNDVGGDGRWIPLHGSVFTPSFAVERVAVSGT